MITSTVSQLPDFAVEEYNIDDEDGSRSMLKVVCPHCSREFWVSRVWLTIYPVMGRTDDPPAYPFGRPCPYGGCYKTAAIPEGLRIVYTEFTKPKRRTIKRRKGK